MGMSGNIWGCQVGVSGFMMSGCILNRLSLPGQLSGFYVRSVVRVVCHVSCQGCLLQVSCQSCLSGQLSGLSFRPVVRVVCQVSCQGCLSGQLSVLSFRSVVRFVFQVSCQGCLSGQCQGCLSGQLSGLSFRQGWALSSFPFGTLRSFPF